MELIIDETFRIDDLQRGGLVLCQKPSSFCFGLDAVLLADFAARRVRANASVMDLCTGNGVIPLLLYARRPKLSLCAAELDEEAAALARYNMKKNGLEQRIFVFHADAKDLPPQAKGPYDAVTVNPPYIPVGSGIPSGKERVSVARHEVALTLAEAVKAAYGILKDRGKFFMVHRAHRAAEVLRVMSEQGLEPKLLQFVQAREGKQANLMLVMGVKNAGVWLDVLPPLIVYNNDGAYSRQINEIYGRTDG